MKLSEIEKYEIKAEAFRIMTGHMAPGKDVSPHAHGASLEERQDAWNQWCVDHVQAVRCAILAMEYVIDRDESEGE